MGSPCRNYPTENTLGYHVLGRGDCNMINTVLTAMREALDAAPEQGMSTRLDQSWLLGFDTETTGTDPGQDNIVSASLVLRNPQTGYEGDAVAEWIINPGRHISKGASRVNGFTDEYLAENGSEPAESIEQIARVIMAAQGKHIPLLAYNAPFDVRMLNGDIRQWCAGRMEPFREQDLLVVDPLVLDRAISHRSGRRTLTYTTEYYGVIPHGDFHNATADTVASVDLIEPMTTLYPQVGKITLDELMGWQREAHDTWQKQFNEWLTSKGRRSSTDTWL